MGYSIPKLPLAVFSGYVGLVIGTFIPKEQPIKERILYRMLNGGSESRGLVNKNNRLSLSSDRLMKIAVLFGSSVLCWVIFGVSADKEYSCEPNFIRPNRPPPNSYRPTPAGDSEVCCSVCLSNKRDTLLDDCRHCVLCWECFTRLYERKCPACQHQISSATYIFTP